MDRADGAGISLPDPVWTVADGGDPLGDIAGRGIANPLGAIFSAAMLLRHTTGLEQGASDIEQAVHEVLDAGYRTTDLQHGHAKHLVTTNEMARHVETAVADVMERRRAYHAV